MEALETKRCDSPNPLEAHLLEHIQGAKVSDTARGRVLSPPLLELLVRTLPRVPDLPGRWGTHPDITFQKSRVICTNTSPKSGSKPKLATASSSLDRMPKLS